MFEFRLKCDGVKLSCQQADELTTGSSGVANCVFAFDGAWTGLIITAMFYTESGAIAQEISDNACLVPAEAMVDNLVRVGVVGINSDGARLASTMVKLYLLDGTYIDTEQVPSPTLWEQYLLQMSQNLSATGEYKNIAYNSAQAALANAVKTDNDVKTTAENATKTAQSAANAHSSEVSAKSSEDNACESEKNAKTSENNAHGSELVSKESEDNAKQSETNAKASELASKTSENSAAESASAAQASEKNASTSATKASASEANAKVSETNSKTSETNAKASESNANTSKQEAQTAKENAHQSAIDAQDAKTAAETAKASAETSTINAAQSATQSANSANAAQTAQAAAELAKTNAETSASETANAVANHNANTTAHEDIRSDISALNEDIVNRCDKSYTDTLISSDVSIAGKAKLTGWVKNLVNNYSMTKTINGLNFTVNANGSITINGTATAYTRFDISHQKQTLSAGTYTLSKCISSNAYFMILTSEGNNPPCGAIKSESTAKTFYLTDDLANYSFRFLIESGTVLDNVTVYPQIELGTTAHAYVPPNGYEVRSCGKNLLDGEKMANRLVTNCNAVKNNVNKIVSYYASEVNGFVVFDKFKANTQYTIMLNGSCTSGDFSNLIINYTDGTYTYLDFSEDNVTTAFVSNSSKSVKSVIGVWRDGNTKLFYEKCGIFEGNITVDDFENYISDTVTVTNDMTTAEINSYDGVTNIMNDYNAEMTAKVPVDLVKYVDNKFLELANATL